MPEAPTRAGWKTRLGRVWSRGPAVIERPWVRLDRARQSVYALAALPGAAADLGAVNSEDGVHDFVGQRGLLHHGPESDVDQERLSDFLAEAATMRELRGVILAVRGAARGTQRDEAQLREWVGGQPRTGRRWSKTAEGIYERAANELANRISVGLEGTHETIVFLPGDGDPRESGRYVFDVSPRDLLGFAYYELARALVNRVPLRTCEECGRLFDLTDQRMRFCGSTCQQRTWRRNKAKGEGSEYGKAR